MVIRSYIQSIEDGLYPKGDLQKSLEVIDDEAQRLDGRIQDLLYFSKIDYLSKHQMVREEFALHETIREVVQSYQHQDTRLQWDVELDETLVVGDREQWRTVTTNMLDNQVRYARSAIAVRLTQDGRQAALELQNDGPPIEPVLMNTMFEAYTKGPKGKTGLGLAIVKRIVELHGGRITTQNRSGGVVFTITLACKERE